MSLFTVNSKNPCGTTEMFNNLLGLLHLSQLLSYLGHLLNLLELSRTGEFDILGVRRLNQFSSLYWVPTFHYDYLSICLSPCQAVSFQRDCVFFIFAFPATLGPTTGLGMLVPSNVS